MSRICLCLSLLATLSHLPGCDRRREIPQAASPDACNPRSLGPAEKLSQRRDLPVDRVVTIEGMPHPSFFGWNHEGKKRAVSKLLGTELRFLLVQDFEGEAPPTSAEMTGLLRRFRDLPDAPWAAVKAGIQKQYQWQIPDDAYVLFEGVTPLGCPR